MKNILNKLGYISKPAIMGAALGIATVAVGIGIVTNFTGNNSGGTEGFSGSALEQYAGNVSSGATASGYSKEDLQASMAAAEMARNNNSVYSLRNAAAKENFAYGRGGVNAGTAAGAGTEAGEGSYNSVSGDVQGAQGGAIDAMGATGSGVSAKAAGAVAPEASAAEKAAIAARNAANAGAMQASADRAVMGQLQTSKLMSGSNVRGGGSGSKGSSASYTLPTAGSDKTAPSAIPQGMAGKLQPGPEADAFKSSGRLAGMGGFNNQAKGPNQGGSGQAYFSTTVAELASAARYSQAGKRTVYGDGEKGVALAEAAFDGSESAAEGIQIDGANVAQSAASELERTANTLGMQPKNNFGSIDPVDYDVNAGKAIKKKLAGKLLAMVGVAVAGFAAIYAALMYGGGWWKYLIAGVATVAAIAGIIALFSSMRGLIKEHQNLQFSSDIGMWSWLPAVAMGLLLAGVGSAWIPGVRNATKKFLTNLFTKIKAFGKNLGKNIGNLFKGAGKTAAKAVGGAVVAGVASDLVGGGASGVSGGASGSGAGSGSGSGSGNSSNAPKGSQEWADQNSGGSSSEGGDYYTKNGSNVGGE